ncbi:ABC transporter permease [Chryseolinea sp. T2]|uniref:ABC transporter permease n=1 Tax=Chryseolinea sp. T2 TaxID=3129255 RepID=UPI003076ECE9
MIRNYLLITFRSLFKNKLYIFINVLGMGIAIACCIIAYFNYDHNASFDENHANASTIYRVGAVREFQNELTEHGYAPIGLGNAIRQNVKEVDEVVRYSPAEGSNFRIGDELLHADVNFVDPSFFKLFTFEFTGGAGDISDRSNICISSELATKFFGSDNAVGKHLVQMLDSGKTRDYIVAGVFKKQPSNSSFYGEAYAHYDLSFDGESDPRFNENGWYYRTTLFVQINDPSKVSLVQERLKGYVENNNRIREDFIIKYFLVEPFVGMGVRDSYSDKQGVWTRNGSPLAAVLGVVSMGVLVLLIACFNLTNTIVAISSRRLKEIGIRKVMGSARRHLIFQFIGETFVICFLALIVGFVLAELWLMPAFNKLWSDFELHTDYWGRPNFVIFLIVTLVITSLLAGSYPAFYISRFQPTTILKGTLKFGGANLFMRMLLCIQFALSLAGIVCSFAFVDNAAYQRDFDLGFNRDGIVYTYVNGRSEFETFRNSLADNDDITAMAGTQSHLFSQWLSDPIKHEDKEIEVSILDVGEDYLPTVGITLTQGRNFQSESANDRRESVIITEDLAKQLELSQPLGAEITWSDTVKYYVVGVVKDIYNKALWRKFDPILFRYAPRDNVRHILVKAPTDKLVNVNKYMESKWKELFPNRMYEGQYMDEEMVEADTVNKNLVTMFAFLGAVAMLLSATGLFTLVSLNIIKKMKEIGVRKVLGASTGNITGVVNREFLIVLGIATALGSVLGWYLSIALMQGIWKYYQSVSVASIIISASILLMASVVSVGYKVYTTTRLNPARVLRTE